ncbi:hypothetical protein O3P69_017308 [Scylla paramamosain]|uniref:Uncharacterized protein n=1 Tax=Scylla paramamosain TaxID=85552 RepID=A0AAW0TZV0_SCYPA
MVIVKENLSRPVAHPGCAKRMCTTIPGIRRDESSTHIRVRNRGRSRVGCRALQSEHVLGGTEDFSNQGYFMLIAPSKLLNFSRLSSVHNPRAKRFSPARLSPRSRASPSIMQEAGRLAGPRGDSAGYLVLLSLTISWKNVRVEEHEDVMAGWGDQGLVKG